MPLAAIPNDFQLEKRPSITVGLFSSLAALCDPVLVNSALPNPTVMRCRHVRQQSVPHVVSAFNYDDHRTISCSTDEAAARDFLRVLDRPFYLFVGIMTQEQTNTFFYLFSEGKGIEILKLTTVEALEMWKRGRHWLDIPQKTLSEAEQLKMQLLASGQR
jgi:hypothetical protein